MRRSKKTMINEQSLSVSNLSSLLQAPPSHVETRYSTIHDTFMRKQARKSINQNLNRILAKLIFQTMTICFSLPEQNRKENIYARQENDEHDEIMMRVVMS